MVIYSDASWPEDHPEEIEEAKVPPRVGWVLFRPGHQTEGHTIQLTKTFVQELLPRKSQIFAAESLAAILVPHLCGDALRDQDVIWFIDNKAAVSSMIRGTSRAEDVGHIAGAAQLMLLALGARVWFEWVDSASNPADGLSRDGVRDEWTSKQGWLIKEWMETDLISTMAACSRASAHSLGSI